MPVSSPRNTQEERRHGSGLCKRRNTDRSPTAERRANRSLRQIVTTVMNEALFNTVMTAACGLLDAFALASSCMSIRPPARMERLAFHWTGFHEIWEFLEKSVD